MIITCTMNPAIDLFIQTEKLLPDVVNRTQSDVIQANGKGVNVSFVLAMLGIESQATGFIGGFTGQYIQSELVKKKVETTFIEVEQPTRINVFTNVTSQQKEYKLVNQGPTITRDAFKQLQQEISQLQVGDVFCLSGSNPKGIDDKDVETLVKDARKAGAKIVLDISSPILKDLISLGLFCIKPNEAELAQLYGKDVLSQTEIIRYGQDLQQQGVAHVLISLGDKGAYYFSDELSLYGNAPQGKLVNSACAGDAMLGTFLGLLSKEFPIHTCFQAAIAAGSATAFSPGLTDFATVNELMQEIVIGEVEKEWNDD